MIGKDNDSIGALLHDVAHLLRTVIDRQVDEHNLTRAKWLALGILDRRDGLSQSELAAELELGVAAVGRLIDRLEMRGFVERRPDIVDRRIKRIYIKPDARPKLGELEQIASDVRALAMRGLSESDQQRLKKTLKTLKANLSEGIQKSVVVVLGVGQAAQDWISVLI